MSSSYGQLGDRGTVKALQTRFSLSPDFSLNLSPEIAGVVTFDMPELLYEQGWRRWSAGALVGALAANAARIRFRNPVASGMIMVIESVECSAAATAEFVGFLFAYVNTTDLAGAVSAGGLSSAADGRMFPSVSCSAVVSSDRIAAIPTAASAYLGLNAANTVYRVPGMPRIVLPGNTWDFGTTNLNQTTDFTIVWRERPIQEQENTP